MTYSKHTWVNGSVPALDATNLNEVEQGIYDAHELNQNLIYGVSPTLIGWTSAPTDGANITDGDISTLCSSGTRVITAAWQYAYFKWNLGAFYDILCTGFGRIDATAGTGQAYMYGYNGSGWDCSPSVVMGNSSSFATVSSGYCSELMLGITADAAATVTPNIREFCAWRLQ